MGSATAVSIYIHDLAVLTAPGIDLQFDALDSGSIFNPDGSWTVRTRTFPVTPEMATAAAAGRLVIVALIGDAMRLSLLRVEGTVQRRDSLRQLHIDNGMGMAPPRAFGDTSYDRTGGAFRDR